MSHSLGEVEALARKAARGGGYSWGMAEEAGFAVRWLCAHGLDGCGALALLLDSGAGACPLAAGTGFADDVARFAQAAELGELNAPLLLLPFVAQAAGRLGGTLTLTAAQVTAVTNGQHTELSAPMPARAAVTITRGGRIKTPLPTTTRATPDASVWQKLTTYAARTYAPESEVSRLSGAGAGLTDND
ncbi:DUF3726 domain-containing protein [Rhodalgimonas zhirmunskyi]|uniref:DUF3726 domain-containing protein n=1 Tax=Rhodalgimonas zhirmunskyi TaxID=2964767 RepID=A0AAJ1U9T1_9RHOB|nr:DUF3726 domain-containing protein [Rhodoalgimonas zhirmunskyi]MDQ2094440.1 DUF3726 domain-containing protein [Rhodoalgimonas zhirmunskyi]